MHDHDNLKLFISCVYLVPFLAKKKKKTENTLDHELYIRIENQLDSFDLL